MTQDPYTRPGCKPIDSSFPDATALRHIQTAIWKQQDTRGAAILIGAGLTRTAKQAAHNAPPTPLWKDFAKIMGKRLYSEGKAPENALRLAEEYEAALGRNALNELISNLINDQTLTPGRHHHEPRQG